MSKILVVDDEPQILLLVKTMLKKQGYEVIIANSGKECLKILKKEKPDLILMDIMMPGEDGWETLKKIKSDKDTNEIPVAMLTVRVSKDSVSKSIESGADVHLDKPFEMKELFKIVEKLLVKQKKD